MRISCVPSSNFSLQLFFSYLCRIGTVNIDQFGVRHSINERKLKKRPRGSGCELILTFCELSSPQNWLLNLREVTRRSRRLASSHSRPKSKITPRDQTPDRTAAGVHVILHKAVSLHFLSSRVKITRFFRDIFQIIGAMQDRS